MTSNIDTTNFGAKFKTRFQLDDKLTHFNNGSFGTVPRQVRESRLQWLDLIESHPDLYIKDRLEEELYKVLNPIARHVNAELGNLTLINNATQGVNIVLRSMEWKQGDIILCMETGYPGVRILLEFLRAKHGIELITIPHNGEEEELIQNLAKQIRLIEGRGQVIKIGVIDAITSVPGLIIPYEQLTKQLKQHGASVLIDGAHAFGQIDLDLESSTADYFVTNMHKWGYAYRPSALLYVKPEHHSSIHPTVITYGYGSGKFRDTFSWPGTIDFSCWLSASAALKFRRDLGDEKIRHYCHNLAWEGGNVIASILNTKVLGREHQTGAMVNVKLPIQPQNLKENLGDKLERLFFTEFHSRIKVYRFNHGWWIRLSAQIYLDLDQFRTLGYQLLKVCRERPPFNIKPHY